jgi:hypothetical protein
VDVSRKSLYEVVGKDEYHLQYAHLSVEERCALLLNQPISSSGGVPVQQKQDRETQEAKRYDRINAQRKRRKIQNSMDLTAVVESLQVLDDEEGTEIKLPIKGIRLA